MRRTVPGSLYRPGPREINSGSSWQLKNRGSIVGRSTIFPLVELMKDVNLAQIFKVKRK